MLQRGECRWPYGDPKKRNFYYCGKSKPYDHPYCGFHMRRAFQPARPREHRPYKSRQTA
jgi:GcrA cell cycle regulator